MKKIMIRKNWFTKVSLFTLLAVIIISIIILSLVPPISRDALVHHLNVPKLYLQHWGMYEIPSLPFSYYPMNLDLIYLIPLHLGNDIAPKFIHFGFGLLTAWLIFGYLKRRLNAIYALFGAVFFLSIPIIVKLSITVYVDLGLIFFSTASLLLLLKWIKTGFQLRYLVLSATMCGLALGTKYNGLLVFFLLTLFVPYLYSKYLKKKKGIIRPVGYGILFVIIALLMFSPWMIRNYLWKANPVYPLYDNWFNPSNPPTLSEIDPEEAEEKGGLGLFAYRTISYNEPWWQIAIIPIRIFFEGKDGSDKYFDGKLNPFLLILPMFAFLKIREENEVLTREKKLLLAFSALFFVFAFFSAVMRVRYIAPIVPPLVILATFGLRNIVDYVKKIQNRTAQKTGTAILVLIVVLLLGMNVLYIIEQFRYVTPFGYLTGAVNREEYITKYRPEYPAMQYVNKNLSAESRLLLIFLGKRGYYCDREYIPDTRGQVNKLYRLIKNARRPNDLVVGFEEMGVTHLIIEIGLFSKWTTDLFDAKRRKLVKAFFANYTSLIYFQNGVGLFRLTDNL
ncbi:dolichyl-phosphate-mannose-protein mannosyltransferase [delta proteobacterium NaphS2]|nr:dolichyl-phosphate-mannose-protein mannosyltransferase [delta proteobacterium NaphS2]